MDSSNDVGAAGDTPAPPRHRVSRREFASVAAAAAAGWLLTAARQRTGKPTLTMETLAERLDPQTLFGLLCHLKDHISLREGRAVPERRAKRIYPKKADPGDFTP